MGGRPNGGSQGWDPGPPWRLFFIIIAVALSWVTQRPLDLFVSSSFLAISRVLLLSGGPRIGSPSGATAASAFAEGAVRSFVGSSFTSAGLAFAGGSVAGSSRGGVRVRPLTETPKATTASATTTKSRRRSESGWTGAGRMRGVR